MDLAPLQELAAQQAAARDAARSYAARVRTEFGSRLDWIRLFGSLARGDWMGPDESDVDIAVVLKEEAAEDAPRLVRLAHEEMLASGFVISPRVFSSDGFRR
ncbi:MAG: nucleotidyltransferase domain-containing protein, partial [Verrucomicrobia bacterium]|nr:nucleotidyltransferase domain-containing protein [Verrucomicrobiota bacterium]